MIMKEGWIICDYCGDEILQVEFWYIWIGFFFELGELQWYYYLVVEYLQCRIVGGVDLMFGII